MSHVHQQLFCLVSRNQAKGIVKPVRSRTAEQSASHIGRLARAQARCGVSAV